MCQYEKILEVEKTLNNCKDAPPSVEHPVIANVWTIEDSLQQQDDHNSVEHSDIQVQEPSKKIHKNHPTIDILGDLEVSVRTRGVPKVNHKEMIGLSLGYYTSTI